MESSLCLSVLAFVLVINRCSGRRLVGKDSCIFEWGLSESRQKCELGKLV